jgi:SAM-dependent methyltransferase
MAEEKNQMDEYRQANRSLWNEWARLHAGSEFYDVESFKAGRSTLNSFELDELSDVTGKSLLHLQCHFGMDTLSWARRGARVTGVDFSDEAIGLAEALNDELGLDGQFVCADIYDLPEVLHGEFDIVYTSQGVLPWLPDLKRWAEVVAKFLKPGGVFYIAEYHPFAQIFDDENASELKVRYPYFPTPEPLAFQVHGSYADPQAEVNQELEYEWVHSMGEVLTSLIQSGLRIDYLHEFPFSTFAMMPELMERYADGLWRLKEHQDSVPLMFSLQARREG